MALASLACGQVTIPVQPAAPAAQPAAAPKPADLPAASEVFDRHIRAVGGLEKLMSVTNRRIRGTFQSKDFRGPVSLQLWQDAPNKWHARVAEPAGTRIDLCYDGTDGWQATSGAQPVWMTGSLLAELADNAVFYGEIVDYAKRYESFETIDKIDYRGRPVYAVQVVPPSKRTTILLFDSDTGLHIGTRTVLTERGTLKQSDVLYGDYKEVSGILVPTSVIQQFIGEPDQTIWKFREVVLNGDEAHDYSPPAGMPPKPEPAPATAAPAP